MDRFGDWAEMDGCDSEEQLQARQEKAEAFTPEAFREYCMDGPSRRWAAKALEQYQSVGESGGSGGDSGSSDNDEEEEEDS